MTKYNGNITLKHTCRTFYRLFCSGVLLHRWRSGRCDYVAANSTGQRMAWRAGTIVWPVSWENTYKPNIFELLSVLKSDAWKTMAKTASRETTHFVAVSFFTNLNDSYADQRAILFTDIGSDHHLFTSTSVQGVFSNMPAVSLKRNLPLSFH